MGVMRAVRAEMLLVPHKCLHIAQFRIIQLLCDATSLMRARHDAVRVNGRKSLNNKGLQ
jgi:hypothetical protein